MIAVTTAGTWLSLPALILVVLVTLAVRRAPFWTAPGRRPRRHHLVTRIICGTLAVLILVAVGVGTWRELRAVYGPIEEPAALTVRVPTMPAAPPLPEPTDENPRPEVKKARFLFYAVIADVGRGRFRPVYVREHELNWPADSGRLFTCPFALSGVSGKMELQVFGLHARHWTPDGPPTLDYHSHLGLFWRDAGGRRSHFDTGLTGLECTYLGEVGDAGVAVSSPWSVVPRPPSKLGAFALIRRVAEDDPLKEATIDRLGMAEDAGPRVRSYEEGMRQFFAHLLAGESSEGTEPPADLPIADILAHSSYADRPGAERRLPRPVGLIRQLGTTSLLLFLAAVFLSQLFVRRPLAFAGMLACVILYAAALDRAVLGAHLGRLADASAPMEARLTACAGTTCTFFYRPTARAALERFEEDASTPPALRDASEAARDWLTPPPEPAPPGDHAD